ncbi:hypothetical protein L7F22_064024 [Adiantum nelumboides]|nr:hypothetical protein [Adiantum nelumboides]
MVFEVCNDGGQAISRKHLEPSSQLPSVPSSSSASPSSPLSPTASSSLSATASSEDLLAAADPSEHLDSFLRDALNSRNRFTVLRLELEVEKFVRNPIQQQLFLNPMPSSYERLAAHRVAQHYHVQSMPFDSSAPSTSCILLVKTLDSRVPSVKLADIPLDARIESNLASPPPGKLAIRLRTREDLIGSSDSAASGRMTPIKTVEERMEEYNKARARIFSNGVMGSRNDEPLGLSDAISSVGSERDESEDEPGVKAANTVAVFRDKEKDMKDPDYDRNYDRYSQTMKIASLSPSITTGLCSSSSHGSSLVTHGGYGQPQRLARYPALDIQGHLWVGARGLPVVGYPMVLQNAFTQGCNPHYSNVYNCNQEFAYPPQNSFVDWRQDPTKVKPCAMSSSHCAGWFQTN